MCSFARTVLIQRVENQQNSMHLEIIMGRLPKNRIHNSLHSNANILKTKHRRADTKYRANVQYLYSKLKEMSQNKVAKDSLLSVTLSNIQALEKEIIGKVGSKEMKSYQDDFKNFLLHEETLWKIKDTAKWWRKVEEALSSHGFSVNEETVYANTPRSKGCNRQLKNATSEFSQASCCDTRMMAYIPTSQTFNGFSARSTKSERELQELESNISSENSSVNPCVSEFNENAFISCETEPDSFLSLEEQNYFSNENSADSIQFENYLF